jgi:signal transduction histidine kinase
MPYVIPHPIQLRKYQLMHTWRYNVNIFSKDNGLGIPKEYVELVFNPLERLKRDQNNDGTGMGLSICRKIVLAHGGKIWVESEVGKGSTFYLYTSDFQKINTKN